MNLTSLIFMGDFNYTVGVDEVWGRTRKMDSIAGMICEEIIEHNLNDICPSKVVPIWDNGRKGEAYIARRLDHFILHETLMEHLGNVYSDVMSNFLSDHRPIVLHLRVGIHRYRLPFKFK